MRVSEKDLIKSEKLVEQVGKLEIDGRKRMEGEMQKVNNALLEFYPEYEKAKILQDPELLWKATNKLNDFYNRRRDLQESFHKEKESLIRQIEQVNFSYVDFYCRELLSEGRRIQAMREHQIVETRTDMASEHGGKIYKIEHNHDSINQVTTKVAEVHKKIRDMCLSPLSEIRRLFDETIKSIPDDFPLTDITEGSQSVLMDFQARQELTVFQTQTRYVNLFATPSFLPK